MAEDLRGQDVGRTEVSPAYGASGWVSSGEPARWIVALDTQATEAIWATVASAFSGETSLHLGEQGQQQEGDATRARCNTGCNGRVLTGPIRTHRDPCRTGRDRRRIGPHGPSKGPQRPSVRSCYYRDGRDSVAWQGDTIGCSRTEDTMVAIVSFGEARRLLLRPRGGGSAISFALAHGDLLVMGGSCQRTWKHAVPKTIGAVGPRVSVQFRPRGVR